MRTKKLWLISLSLLLSGCGITLPNTRACAIAGKLSYGADCVETVSGKASVLTFDEYLDFLEAQPERDDPAHPGQKLPPHGAAICQSAEDWKRQKTALQQACKKLGGCSREVTAAIKNLDAITQVQSLHSGS